MGWIAQRLPMVRPRHAEIEIQTGEVLPEIGRGFQGGDADEFEGIGHGGRFLAEKRISKRSSII
jgi:hypothetical protein